MENKNYNFRPELFNFLQKKEKEIPIHELPIVYEDYICMTKKEQEEYIQRLRLEFNRPKSN